MAPDLPKHTDFENIFASARRLISSGYDLAFCILDIDSIKYNNQLQKFKNICKKLPKSIIPITSNACIEIWFFLHFMDYTSDKGYSSCQEVVRALEKYIINYEKTKEFLSKEKVFKMMEEDGKLARALKHASKLLEKLKQKPENCSYTEISCLISQLELCRECGFEEDCVGCSRNTLSVLFR